MQVLRSQAIARFCFCLDQQHYGTLAKRWGHATPRFCFHLTDGGINSCSHNTSSWLWATTTKVCINVFQLYRYLIMVTILVGDVFSFQAVFHYESARIDQKGNWKIGRECASVLRASVWLDWWPKEIRDSELVQTLNITIRIYVNYIVHPYFANMVSISYGCKTNTYLLRHVTFGLTFFVLLFEFYNDPAWLLKWSL
jgi:hypothetical protein